MDNLRITATKLVSISVLMICICAPTAAAAQRTVPCIVAVIPSAPPEIIHTQWAPFLERLTRDTGREFRLKVYEKMSDFERDVSKGVPDLLFANPLQTVVAHQAQGYVPLVRSSKLVSAEIFVLKDSPIRTIDDLENKRVAFVGIKNL